MPSFASNASKEDGKENAAYVIRERSMTWGVGFSLFASRRGVSSTRSISSIGEELSKLATSFTYQV